MKRDPVRLWILGVVVMLAAAAVMALAWWQHIPGLGWVGALAFVIGCCGMLEAEVQGAGE